MKMVDGHVVEQEDMLQRFSNSIGLHKFHTQSQKSTSFIVQTVWSGGSQHFPAESNGEEGVGPRFCFGCPCGVVLKSQPAVCSGYPC